MGSSGSGSSGGGGSSGAVSYPAYMQAVHGDWLNNNGVDSITQSITDTMNAAFGNSPWTAAAAYNPDADIVDLLASPNALQTLVTLLSSGTTLDNLIAGVLDETRILTSIAAFTADLDARLVAEILPRFEAGMRDINAVTSSAFAIGRALIEENQDRQVAKYDADLRMKVFSDDALRVIALKLEYQKAAAQMVAEAYRVKIVAKKEEMDVNIKIEESDALWDLEVFQYGANLLAGIGGGTNSPNTKRPSQSQSMIGGALSGAAAGAMVGATAGVPWLGAGIGAVLGAASSLL